MRRFRYLDNGSWHVVDESDISSWWDEKYVKMSEEIKERLDIEYPDGYPLDAKVREFVGTHWASEVDEDDHLIVGDEVLVDGVLSKGARAQLRSMLG